MMGFAAAILTNTPCEDKYFFKQLRYSSIKSMLTAKTPTDDCTVPSGIYDNNWNSFPDITGTANTQCRLTLKPDNSYEYDTNGDVYVCLLYNTCAWAYMAQIDNTGLWTNQWGGPAVIPTSDMLVPALGCICNDCREGGCIDNTAYNTPSEVCKYDADNAKMCSPHGECTNIPRCSPNSEINSDKCYCGCTKDTCCGIDELETNYKNGCGNKKPVICDAQKVCEFNRHSYTYYGDHRIDWTPTCSIPPCSGGEIATFPCRCEQNEDCSTGDYCHTDGVCGLSPCSIGNTTSPCRCELNEDCSVGQYCHTDGQCGEPPCSIGNTTSPCRCELNEDCSVGQYCHTDGQCGEPPCSIGNTTSPCRCELNEDCSVGQYCHTDGQCGLSPCSRETATSPCRCELNEDCSVGQYCHTDGQCSEPPCSTSNIFFDSCRCGLSETCLSSQSGTYCIDNKCYQECSNTNATVTNGGSTGGGVTLNGESAIECNDCEVCHADGACAVNDNYANCGLPCCDGSSFVDGYCVSVGGGDDGGSTGGGDNGCKCGSSVCTSDTPFCFETTSRCSNLPLCIFSNGMNENPSNCECDSSICTSDTGLYCSGGQCYSAPKCVESADVSNEHVCVCNKNEICTSDTGFLCHADGNCRFVDCAVSDKWNHTVSNITVEYTNEKCQCSENACEINQVCVDGECRPGPECQFIDGKYDQIHPGPCACGSTDCLVPGSAGKTVGGFCDEETSTCAVHRLNNCVSDGKTQNDMPCRCHNPSPFDKNIIIEGDLGVVLIPDGSGGYYNTRQSFSTVMTVELGPNVDVVGCSKNNYEVPAVRTSKIIYDANRTILREEVTLNYEYSIPYRKHSQFNECYEETRQGTQSFVCQRGWEQCSSEDGTKTGSCCSDSRCKLDILSKIRSSQPNFYNPIGTSAYENVPYKLYDRAHPEEDNADCSAIVDPSETYGFGTITTRDECIAAAKYISSTTSTGSSLFKVDGHTKTPETDNKPGCHIGFKDSSGQLMFSATFYTKTQALQRGWFRLFFDDALPVSDQTCFIPLNEHVWYAGNNCLCKVVEVEEPVFDNETCMAPDQIRPYNVITEAAGPVEQYDFMCAAGQYCYATAPETNQSVFKAQSLCANFKNPRKINGQITRLCEDGVLNADRCYCGNDAANEFCEVGEYCKLDFGKCWKIPVDTYHVTTPVLTSGRCSRYIDSEEDCALMLDTMFETSPYIDTIWHRKSGLYELNTCTSSCGVTNFNYGWGKPGDQYPQGCIFMKNRKVQDTIDDYRRVEGTYCANNPTATLCDSNYTPSTECSNLYHEWSDGFNNFESKKCCDKCPYEHETAHIKYMTFNGLSSADCSSENPCICHPEGYPQCPDLRGLSNNIDECVCNVQTDAQATVDYCSAEQYCLDKNVSSQYRGCKNEPICASVNGETLNTQRCHCALLKDEYFSDAVYCPAGTHCDAEIDNVRTESCNKIPGQHKIQDGVVGPDCPFVDGLTQNIDTCICPVANVSRRSVAIFAGNEDSYTDDIIGRHEYVETLYNPPYASDPELDVGFRASPFLMDELDDGSIDMYVGSFGGEIYYYKNTGATSNPSTFEHKEPYDITGLHPGVKPFFVDTDGDGDKDLYIGYSGGHIWYYENTGTPTNPTYTWRTGGGFPQGVDVGDYAAPAFADTDGDGDMDAYIGNEEGEILYFKNTGTPTNPVFEQQNGHNQGLSICTGGECNPRKVNGGFSSPTFADTNGDGDMDMYVGTGEGQIWYYENEDITHAYGADNDYTLDGYSGYSSNIFVWRLNLIVGTNSADKSFVDSHASPFFVDDDGDDDMDIYIGNYDGEIVYYESRGGLGYIRRGEPSLVGEIVFDPYSAGPHGLDGGSYIGSHDSGIGRGLGRLDSIGAWVPWHGYPNTPGGQWWQIELPTAQIVVGTVTQGSAIWTGTIPGLNDNWVTSWKFKYWDNAAWKPVDNDFVFAGNTDKNTKVEQTFRSPVLTTKIRFYSQTWNNLPGARMALRTGILINDGDISTYTGCMEADYYNTGLYCNNATGCTIEPICANRNGAIINAGTCQCGTNTCSDNMYCYSPQSFCYPKPNRRKTKYKNGERPVFEYIQKMCVEGVVAEDCICGDVHVCPAGSSCTNGQCHMPECSEVDGSDANPMGCGCGEAVCFSETGQYCQKNISTKMDNSDFIELSGEDDDRAENLQECSGECDGDWQCATGLKCFERSNGENIPGCKGNGGGDSWDYCYDPAKYAYIPGITRHDYCAPDPNWWPVILGGGTFDYIIGCPGSFVQNEQRCSCNSNAICSFGDYCIDEQYCSANMKCRFNDGIELHGESNLCICSESSTCKTSFEACYESGICSNPKCAAGGSSLFQAGCKCYGDGQLLDTCSMTQYCYNPPGNQQGGCKNEPINRCFNREGDTPNDDYDICLCGSNANRRKFCTKGQYCNDDKHMCSDIPNPTCENTNGLFTNGDTTCLCMDEDDTYDICQPFQFCNVGADKKCHKQYCRDYVYGEKQLCNVQDTVSQSREVDNQEQIFETVVTYGNGLVQQDKECTTTDVNGICQPESFKECCRECPSDNTHILGTGLCQSDCDYGICTGEWIPPPTEGTRISFSTRFWNKYEIQSRLNSNWTNYCYGESCDVNDQKTCCVKPETCPIGKELLLCQELKHTRAYKDDATCSDFECTAEDCCEVRECTCTGGTPKPAYDCPQDGKEECDYCNKTYWKTANQTCSPIIECLATQFETLPPTPRIRNRACQDLTVCVGDEFISTNETIRTGDPTSDVYDLDVAISDRTCQNRTRCLQTEYQPSVPNEYQDRRCIPLTACGTEEYADREWDGQQWTEDSDCKPKTICAPSEYIVSNGTKTTDRNCSAIDPPCPQGKLETQAPIPGIRNRFCQEPRECTADEYETQAPNATQNRECAPLTECSETQYESQAQTTTVDRVCSALTECSATQYQSVAPTNTTNRQCANVTVCDPNNNEYEGTPPTVTTDRQCDNCTDCVGCVDKNDCTFDPDAKISYLDVSPIGANTCSGHTCTNYDVGGTNQHVVFHPAKGALEYGRYYRFNLKIQATLTIAGVQLFKGRVASGMEASIDVQDKYIYFQIPMNHPESTAITYKPGQGTATAFALERDCQQTEHYVGSKDGSPVCTSVCGDDGSVLLKRTTEYGQLGDGAACLPTWTSTPCVCSSECPSDYAIDIDTFLTGGDYNGACFNEDCKCPVDCVYTVNDDFEPCDAPCGEQGFKIKKIVVTTPAAHKGKACPAYGAKETCKGDYEIIRTSTYENQNKCDCDGNTMDRCGICGGKNRCVGCDGIPVLSNGNAILPDGREVSGYRKQVRDRCGICGGDGSTCAAKFKLKAENKKTTSHALQTGLPIIIAVVVIAIFVAVFYCIFKKPEYVAIVTEDKDEENGYVNNGYTTKIRF
jgi:hypothetical protein